MDLLDDGRGNTIEQPDDEVMPVHPLLMVTPRLLFMDDHFNKQYIQ